MGNSTLLVHVFDEINPAECGQHGGGCCNLFIGRSARISNLKYSFSWRAAQKFDARQKIGEKRDVARHQASKRLRKRQENFTLVCFHYNLALRISEVFLHSNLR